MTSRACFLLGAVLGPALAALALATIAGATEAFVATTTFEISGSTSRVQLDGSWSTTLDEYTIHSDAVVRHDGRYLYVLNRLFSDNVLVLDPLDAYAVLHQYTVTDVGANPRDFEGVSPTKAYVSLYETNLLRVGNPVTGALSGTIDLSVFADSDGLVEADQMTRLGERLFVALQQLDRSAGWIPTGQSTVAVIDTATDTLFDTDPSTPALDGIALQYQNPFWEMRYEGILGRIVVICAGRFLSLDGALEVLNPFTLRSEGALLTEVEAGGDLLDYVLVHAGLGYALIEKANFDTALIRFDPSTGTRIDEVYSSAGFQLQDLELSEEGILVMGDRTPSAPGLRLFDAATGGTLAGPISVGLPPFDIVLVSHIATAAPEESFAAELRAWPNPGRQGLGISLRAPRSESGAGTQWRIHDLRGRLVRELPSRGEVTVWDGRDTEGRSLAPGIYFARPRGISGRAVKITLLRP